MAAAVAATSSVAQDPSAGPRAVQETEVEPLDRVPRLVDCGGRLRGGGRARRQTGRGGGADARRGGQGSDDRPGEGQPHEEPATPWCGPRDAGGRARGSGRARGG